MIETRRYADPIPLPDSLEVVSINAAISPIIENNKNRIQKTGLDGAGRKISVIDVVDGTPQNDLIESYQLNACGKIEATTDRAGNVWETEWDRAQFEAVTLTPEVNCAEITQSADGHLVSTVKKQALRTEYRK